MSEPQKLKVGLNFATKERPKSQNHTNRYQKRKGYFSKERAIFFHVCWIPEKNITNPNAFTLTREANGQKYYGQYGNSRALLDDHILLQIDPTELNSLSPAKQEELRKMRLSATSDLFFGYIKNISEKLHKDTAKIDFFRFTEETKEMELGEHLCSIWHGKDKRVYYKAEEVLKNPSYFHINNALVEAVQEINTQEKPKFFGI